MPRPILALSAIILLLVGCGSPSPSPKPVKWPAPPSPQPNPTVATHHRLGDTYWQLSTVYAGAKLFGLTYVRSVVNSAYWYEGGLIGSIPVADVDYLLPYSAQEFVSLPGGRDSTYWPAGTFYLPGSGWVSAWISPNGGRFAFLHMSRLWLGSATAKVIKHPPPGVAQDDSADDQQHDGDENVIKAIGGLPERRVGVGGVPGGSVVGSSGWPTSSIYANGFCCDWAANAHLCLVLDAAAANWFYRLYYGAPTPPKPPKKHRKPFPAAKWNRYHRTHHLRLMPYKKHGHLTWPASIFKWHVKGLHSFIRATWNGKVNSYRYVGGVAYANPRRHKHVWIKWRKPPRRSGVGWKPIPVIGLHGRRQ